MTEKESHNHDLPHKNQKLYDNIFLWLIVSIVISGLIYNVWGLLELFVFIK